MNLKDVIYSIIDIQNTIISKLKYSNDVTSSLTGDISNLSGSLNTFVKNDELIQNYFNKSQINDEVLSGYSTKEDYNLLSSHVVTTSQLSSISYNDLNDKPFIPTKLSHLTNDMGFIKETYQYTETDPIYAAESGQFALKSEITNLISAEFDPLFTEVSGSFALKSDIVNLISAELDPLFAAQSGEFVLKSEKFSGSYEDLTDKPIIPSALSDLTNDVNFATETYVNTQINNTLSGIEEVIDQIIN